MTGKDLFASLNYVDDALIEEAETYAPARILPLTAVRRFGALAACVCVLVGLAVMLRLGLFSGTGASDKVQMNDTAMEMFAESESCMEEAETEEETAEAETETVTEEEGAAAADTAAGAQPTDKPVADENTAYYVISSAASAEDYDGKINTPENGDWICEFGLREQVMTILRIQSTPTMAGGTGKKARFLAAFRLVKDGEPVDENSDEYLAEVQRLTELGYEFRALRRDGRRKESKVLICGLFTAEQLDEFTAREFDASADYGYIFYFPENKDGTPLDWEDYDELCGLPLVENAEE